jgi:tetraacyldisaccharide 4'-kinase
VKPLAILLPFSWIYCGIVKLRNRCYDRGLFRIFKADVPVISVGNITAGGTGKTPFVEYLIRYFLQRGIRVALISRGYKRKSSGPVAIQAGGIDRGNARMIGDEPYQMAGKFPHAVVIVDANRARAAKAAVDEYRAQVIILDDGFQHRKLARDLDIVMIDSKSSLTEMRYLPAGYKRESVESLTRADLIAYTSIATDTKTATQPVIGKAPSITVAFKPKALICLHERKKLSPDQISGKKVLAFCGIGNPASFNRTLESLGTKIVKMMAFPDHHFYSNTDIQKIRSAYEEGKFDFVITTEKDAARLDPVLLDMLPPDASLYLEIEAVMSEGREVLEAMLETILKVA